MYVMTQVLPLFEVCSYLLLCGAVVQNVFSVREMSLVGNKTYLHLKESVSDK